MTALDWLSVPEPKRQIASLCVTGGGCSVVPETDELEQELHRNLKLRRELGGEVRLELLTAHAAAAKGDASYRRQAPQAEGTFSNRLVRTAWIALGAIGLVLGTLIAVWLT
jgi:hypothetical protein